MQRVSIFQHLGPRNRVSPVHFAHLYITWANVCREEMRSFARRGINSTFLRGNCKPESKQCFAILPTAADDSFAHSSQAIRNKLAMLDLWESINIGEGANKTSRQHQPSVLTNHLPIKEVM